MYLTPCCVQAVMAEKDIRNVGEGGGVSHATRLHLPTCQQNQNINRPSIPVLSICSFVCEPHNSPLPSENTKAGRGSSTFPFLPSLDFQGLTWLCFCFNTPPISSLYLTMAPNSITWQVLLADGRMKWVRGRFKGGDMCVHIADSLCCTPETNNIVKQLCSI